MSVHVLSEFLSVYCMYAVPKEARRSDKPSGLELETVEILCGCWKPNLGLLEELPVILATEPSLQHL